ncbi:hypothetical protein CsSME_00034104 [Camellia sinensis var. sinensis]
MMLGQVEAARHALWTASNQIDIWYGQAGFITVTGVIVLIGRACGMPPFDPAKEMRATWRPSYRSLILNTE